MQTPTVGRAVHFYESFKGEPLAAIVTQVFDQDDNPGGVSLVVFEPTGVTFRADIPFSENPKIGHWSWPPRV